MIDFKKSLRNIFRNEKKELKKEIANLEKANNILRNDVAEFNEIKNKPVESISFDEWEKNNKNKNFIDYWEDILQDKYNSWHIFKISRNPLYLKLLLLAMIDVDYEYIQEYMSRNEWYWNDKKTIPTVNDIQSNILELACLHLDENYGVEYSVKGNTTSSGGFNVKLFFDEFNNLIEVKIDFEYSQAFIN